MTKFYLGYLLDKDIEDSDLRWQHGGLVCSIEESPCRGVDYVEVKGRRKKGRARYKEVVVECVNERTARNFSQIIYSCIALLSEMAIIDRPPEICLLTNMGALRKINEYETFDSYCSDMVIHGLKLAQKVYRDPKAKFALLRYYAASLIADIDGRDTEPGMCYMNMSDLTLADQVRIGIAIQTQYSVVEELGLACPMKKGDGKFLVYDEKKHLSILRRAGIPEDEKIVWNRRGKPTKVEASIRGVIKGDEAPWFGHIVRDLLVPINIAINAVRILRNRYIAHHFLEDKKERQTPIVSSISMFDLSNAKTLSRICLMRYLGIGQSFFDDLNKEIYQQWQARHGNVLVGDYDGACSKN